MEKIFRKTDFICRAAIMLLLLMTSATAWAQTSASYRAYNTGTKAFEILTANSCTAVTSGPTTMNSGWYIVNSNVTINSRITVNGTVNLILADGYSLTASQGITVNSGNTLNIYGQTSGTGALNATGVKLGGDGTEAAGIGSTGYSAVGNITIHGGRITATGADWSAGIGGGVHGGVGSVTIYGGTTLATAGDPNYGSQDAIGSGSEGSNVTKTLADGLRVTTYNNTTPVAYGNRVSNLQEKKVTVEPCTSHNLSNNVCTFCGLTIYTVTYNGNNATSGTVPASPATYQSGTTVTVLGNTGSLARTGYTYSGWNTQANGSGTDYTAGATFAISGNTTLYAKWTPITYTVRFHKNHNDATGTMSDQTFTYDAAQTLTANAFTRDGYDFVGWSTTTDGAVDYTDGQSVTNLANVQDAVVNLYARWATLYTITYNLAGGTVATPNPTTYSELSAAITLTNPTRDGYTFAGWTGTGLAEPTKTVTIPAGSTGNRSYTATWDVEGTYLAYNTATGKFEMHMVPDNITSVTSSTTTMGADNTVTWYTVDDNATVSSRIEVAGTVNLVLCNDKTLTASQGLHVPAGVTLNIYGQSGGTGALIATSANDSKAGIGGNDREGGGGNVTIHGGNVTASTGGHAAGIGGGYSGSGGIVTIYGGTVNATSGSFGAGIGGGHKGNGGTITIVGGTVNATGGSLGAGIGGGPYRSGGTITITGGTVMATAGENAQAIGNGYSPEDAAGTLTLGDMKAYTSAEATTPVALAERESTCHSGYVKLMPCTDHNYSDGVCTYCGFTIYLVTYDGNNATSGTVPTDANEYTSGQTVTVLGNTGDLVRTGYTFGGWNTQADGLGTDYAPGATFTISDNTTLYAKWTPITYSITYDLAGGTVATANPASYTIESTAITLTNPTREGYTFAGWTGTDINGTATTVTIASGSTGNREYTATWTPIAYTITYNLAGGTVTTDNPTNYNVESGTITLVNPTKDGYTFAGWIGTGLTEPTMTVTIPTGSMGNQSYIATWAANQLALANNADNGDDIDAASDDGMYYDVTLAGRTLYTDGDWNTLCLPFDVDDFTGTPLEGAAVKTLESSSFSDGTLTITFSDNLTSIDAGKPYIVKYDADLVIRTASDWNTFADNVTNSTDTYEGKVVKLAADISVSKMVGTNGKEFKGTFDGCGHTLNVTLSGSGYYVAPFSYVNGCTIKNLIVTGTVNGGMHCSGLVGGGGGSINSSLIENCDVRVAVKCNQGSKKTHCGGFIGHSLSGSFTFRNCKFSGSISGATTYTGVFMGWAGQPATHINCLAAGTYSYKGTLAISKGTNTYNNCYTTRSIGSDCTYTTATGELLRAMLGSGWEVSGGKVVPKMNPDIVNPVFTGVTISNTPANVETQYADFIGTYTYMGFTAEDRSILFLGAKNTLYYPQSGAHLGACRAYFRLKGLVAGDIKEARMYFEEDSSEATIISPAEIKEIAERADAAWYTLDGRKLNAKPTKKGLYIYKGKKVKK